jgi:hypothetical protein
VAAVAVVASGLPATAGPAPRTVTRTFYFTGQATDEANKLADRPTATFSAERPRGADSVSQLTHSPVARGLDARSPWNAYWEAPFRGTLDGKVVLRMWWGDPLPPAIAARQLALSLVADPAPACLPPLRLVDQCPKERVIGSGTVVVTAAEPGVVVATFAVRGTVTDRLLVQARPLHADAGAGLRTLYGSAAHPASMTLITRR